MSLLWRVEMPVPVKGTHAESAELREKYKVHSQQYFFRLDTTKWFFKLKALVIFNKTNLPSNQPSVFPVFSVSSAPSA
jgi:hypothetical protein